MAARSKGDGDTRSAAEAFAEIYEEYLPKVFRYVSYRVGDIYLAEDLTSTVFEKALTRLSSFRSDKASFSTWLFSIARNVVIDYYRATSRHTAGGLAERYETDSNRESPEEEVEKREGLRRLHTSLAALPEREQEIVSLKFGAEMTNRQIAVALNLSESNVGTILYRVIGQLRQNLKGW